MIPPPQKLPRRVALPEVSRYTEDIVFGGLDFPLGFDQSSLIVSLRSFDRIRKVAGLGTINVFAANSEAEPFDTGVTGVDAQGAATMGMAGKRRKKPVASSSLDFSHSEMGGRVLLGKPDAIIKVDNTEVEKQIEENGRYKKGVFDPKARAVFLNKAVTKGLSEANFSASFSVPKLALSGINYSIALAMLAPDQPPEVILANGLLAQMLVSGLYGFVHSMERGGKPIDYIKQGRFSLFYGLTPDRYLAGNGLIAASKLIRARS
jgi:hypothetical protein